MPHFTKTFVTSHENKVVFFYVLSPLRSVDCACVNPGKHEQHKEHALLLCDGSKGYNMNAGCFLPQERR